MSEGSQKGARKALHTSCPLPSIISYHCVVSLGSISSWSVGVAASGRKWSASPCPVQPYLMYSRACTPAPTDCTTTAAALCSAQIRQKMYDFNLFFGWREKLHHAAGGLWPLYTVLQAWRLQFRRGKNLRFNHLLTEDGESFWFYKRRQTLGEKKKS